MALNGRAGHKLSHAPQPMHLSTLTEGIFGAPCLPLCAIIVMAPAGQWRAQLPQLTPSLAGRQFFMTSTA